MKKTILEQKGDYALILNPINSDLVTNQFIIAYKPKETESGLEWAQGHYYNDDMIGAVIDFLKKTTFEHIPYIAALNGYEPNEDVVLG